MRIAQDIDVGEVGGGDDEGVEVGFGQHVAVVGESTARASAFAPSMDRMVDSAQVRELRTGSHTAVTAASSSR